MSEETDQTTNEPEGEIGPMTESAAAALLQEWKDEPEQQEPAVETARVKSNQAEEAAAEAEAEAAGSEAGDETPAETEPEEGQSEEEAPAEEAIDDFVHGNAKTRLRDGSEITVGELKKLADEAKDYRRRQSEFDAQRREFEEKTAQAAQKEQQIAATISQAINALQHTIPPEPDPDLIKEGSGKYDPIAFFQQKHQRDAKLAELHGLQAAQSQAAQEAQAKQHAEFQTYLKREQEQLYDRVPDLRDDGKRREFYSDMLSAGKHYGFTEDEINNTADHRLMVMMKDAISWRKLNSKDTKAKVAAKVAGAKPATKSVAQPAARAATPTKASAQQKAKFQRFTKTRSIDDAGALLADFE